MLTLVLAGHCSCCSTSSAERAKTRAPARAEEEIGKTVVGENWPLEEKVVEKDEFIQSYVESGRVSGKRIGFFMGKDEKYYYFVWYMMNEKKLVLLECPRSEFSSTFPSAEDDIQRKRLLPKRPPQPIGLRNKHLRMIIRERKITRLGGSL